MIYLLIYNHLIYVYIVLIRYFLDNTFVVKSEIKLRPVSGWK